MSSLKTVEIHEMQLDRGPYPKWYFRGAVSWRGGECQFVTSIIHGLNFSGNKPPKTVIADLEKVLAEAEMMHLEYDVKTHHWDVIREE